MQSIASWVAGAAMAVGLVSGPVLAQDAPAAPAAPAADATPAPAATSGPAATAETVVATVNGKDITLGHMIALVKELPQQYQSLPDDVLFNGVLEQLIQQSVLSGELDSPTRTEQLEIDNQERAMQAGLVLQRVLAKDISDEELQAAYDEMFKDYKPETEYHAAHILVPTEDEAKAIEEELKNGGDFAAIAKEKSKDPGSAANGGDLGWFGTGMMVPEFEKAVVDLPAGEVSDPVQTQFGWHVIKVLETRDKAKPTLEETRDQLIESLRDKQVQAEIAKATDAATITRSAEGIDPSTLRKTELLSE